MNLFEMTENLAKKMKWYDFSLFKTAMIFWTLFSLTVIPGLGSWAISIKWYYHLVIALVLTIPLWKKIFSD